MLCKKKPKTLKYKSDFIITKLYLAGVMYFSIDGFNFNHSRTERFNLNTLFFSNRAAFDLISVIEVSKISDGTTLTNIPKGTLSKKVNNQLEILILIDGVNG